MRIESRVRSLEQRLTPAEYVVVLCYGETPEEQRAECERQAAAYPEARLVCVLTNACVR
jgi:hypothetical protein